MAQHQSAARWRAECQAVRKAYPSACLYQRRNGRGETVEGWRGVFDPIPDPKETPLILADLDEGLPVNIGPWGKIRHSRSCDFAAEDHRRQRVRLSIRPFTVELEYPSQWIGKAGPVHPKLRVLDPEVSYATHPHHPHLFYNQLTEDSWACPLSAQDTTWQWEIGGTVEYLDHCAIWLLKTEVWVATGGRVLPDLGLWVGPDTSHRPIDVLAESDIECPCRCGRGQKYADCCLVSDVRSAIQTI